MNIDRAKAQDMINNWKTTYAIMETKEALEGCPSLLAS